MSGNAEVNEIKLEKVLGGAVRPGHPDELKEITGADAGSIGPIGFKGKIVADNRIKDCNNLFSGANKNDYYIGGLDFTRDVSGIEYADLRSATSGEGCPKCGEPLGVFTAIELGHIFKLGTKYSASMGANYLTESGDEKPIVMGSYGIGVERVVACSIEQNHDDNGIIWHKAIAPFHVHLLGLNMKKEPVIEASEKVYNELQAAGIEVLFDDRPDAQAGFKFKDADLLGMPLQVIVGEKKLAENKVEIKVRKTGERLEASLEGLASTIKDLLEKI